MTFLASSALDGSTNGIQDDPPVLHMDRMPGTYFIGVAIDPDETHAGDPTMKPLFYVLFVTAETPFVAIPEPAWTGGFLLLIGLVTKR